MLPLVYRSRSLLIPIVRHHSSLQSKSRIGFGGRLLVRIVGATAIVATGYTWYYFSSVKKVVDRIQETLVYLEQARDNLSKGNLPSQALWFLLQAIKCYVAFPGSDYIVDKVFDTLRDPVDAHADQANAYIAKAYTQIRDIIQQDGEKHVVQHTAQIMGIMGDLTKELQPSALALTQMAEKYEVKKRVNEGLAATRAIIQDSKGRFDQLRQQIKPQKPVDNDAPQPAADATPSKSNDDR